MQGIKFFLSATFLVGSLFGEAPQEESEPLTIDWFLGSWSAKESEDAEPIARLEYKKILDGAFIQQDFSIFDADGSQDQGMQIIGWDPILQQLFSNLYDEESGVGKGLWTQEEDLFTVEMVYTDSSGLKGSGTHVYKKQDENSFLFFIKDRSMDGVILEESGQTLFKREKQ